MIDRERFLKPDSFVRSFPFWAWNGRLDPEEIRRQAGEMKAQGMGGFFMHSREGLETGYMGEEWMRCIQAGAAAAKELGMYAWLYDEDRWPSGTAGGLVTGESDDYRCKGLTMEVCGGYREEVWEEKEMLAVYAARVKGDDIFALRRLRAPKEGKDSLQEGEACLVVRLEVSGSSQWFNNQTPPDNLNPDCVKRFISLTHEKYKALLGEEFGRTIPGIFTDEPSLADTHTRFPENRSWIPWTYGFGDYFEKKRGYDPLELIPYFYFNGEKSTKIRHDYWYVIAVRFSESYAKTLSEWCEANGLLMTGHFLQEDKLGLAVRVSGAVMPLYEYEHVPGIDMLQEKTEEFLTVKQCASVAHQMGRRQVLSETYGCTGWEFTFEGQRAIGDWQYVLGVNRRCQHLALYSLAGCRKRDYPPCFNYNTSWWNHNHAVEDYFARLGVMLEAGVPVQRILLLHPVSTAWSRLGASPYGNPVRRKERDVPAVNEYGNRFNELIKNLCFHHFDMDLGDEIILAKHARVEKDRLRVGEADYSVWVLPPIDNLLRSTYAVIKDYVAAGGKLIVMKPFATMLEGEADSGLAEFWDTAACCVAEDEGELLQALEKLSVRTISVRDEKGDEDLHCLAQQRRDGEDETLFLVNYDRQCGHKVTVALWRPGTVEEWDALTGETYPVAARWKDGVLTFPVELDAADSKLYRILSEDRVPLRAADVCRPRELFKKGGAARCLPDQTDISCTTDNTLTLDCCRYRLDGEEWSEDMLIWQAEREARERLGMRPIHYNGQEQRYRWIGEPHPSDGKILELQMRFWVEKLPEGPVSLALEHPEDFEITFNGCPVERNIQGWLLDREICRVALGYVREGDNRITLRCGYRNDMELEECYLCGEFGVTTGRAVTDMPRKLRMGDWTKQGFFHYAGSIRYLYPFEWDAAGGGRILLDLPEYEAVCLGVCVNDHALEVPWKAALPLDITDLLRPGENRLAIEVVSSPRNLLGPFHLKAGKRDVTNDKCFRAEGEDYTPEYNVVSYGLYQAPVLYEIGQEDNKAEK